jgi:hypothetical protein
MKRTVTAIVISLGLLYSASCDAQIEFVNSIDFGYPIMINKNNQNFWYKQFSAGLMLGVSYKPVNTQFFPTLKLAFGRLRLPLKTFGENTVDLNYNYTDLTLNGNLVLTFGQNSNTVYFLAGIGFAKLNDKGTFIAGKNGLEMTSYIDSTANISKYFPAISGGIEYVYGQSVNQPVYLCFGLSVQYIYLLSGNNTYRVKINGNTVNSQEITANMEGHAITPMFYIALHYLMGKNLIFWHKHSSMYL